ncbi:MAG: cytochrome-c oxidase, partial [Mesorhizobium sp.]
MSVILVFLLVIAGFAGWWLSHQRLMAKPWLEQGLIGDTIGLEGSPLPTAKIGLGVFLAVVGCLFALFTSAYFMRMALSDWQA